MNTQTAQTTTATIPTVDQIKAHLRTDRKWCGRALAVLVARQTAQERIGHHTNEVNGMGFNQPDADLLTSYAEQYAQRGTLTVKQWNWCHKLLPKYAGQLRKVAIAKAAAAGQRDNQTEALIAEANDVPQAADVAAVQAKMDEAERIMHEIEARGDREQTIREETAKAEWKASVEYNPDTDPDPYNRAMIDTARKMDAAWAAKLDAEEAQRKQYEAELDTMSMEELHAVRPVSNGWDIPVADPIPAKAAKTETKRAKAAKRTVETTPAAVLTDDPILAEFKAAMLNPTWTMEPPALTKFKAEAVARINAMGGRRVAA